jgi:hypothetical protein
VSEPLEVVEALKAQPGDLVILRFNKHLRSDQIGRLAEQAGAALPEGVRCMIVDNEVSIEVERGVPA